MVRVAEEWLATCGGCEVTILDIGEPLLELLPKQEIFDTVYRGTKSTDAGDTPATDIPPP